VDATSANLTFNLVSEPSRRPLSMPATPAAYSSRLSDSVVTPNWLAMLRVVLIESIPDLVRAPSAAGPAAAANPAAMGFMLEMTDLDTLATELDNLFRVATDSAAPFLMPPVANSAAILMTPI